VATPEDEARAAEEERKLARSTHGGVEERPRGAAAVVRAQAEELPVKR